MEQSLQLVKTAEFNGVKFDCYQDSGKEFWGTREQIGRMLEYAYPREAIAKIHERNAARFKDFSTEVNLTTVEGGRKVTREVVVYNFKGLLEICRYSNQPKADAVMDFLWEVADEIRRTGSYGTNFHTNPEALEVERKKLEFEAEANKVEKAKFLSTIASEFKEELPRSTLDFLLAYAINTVVGVPVATQSTHEKLYSATEIGELLGVDKNAVGRVANNLGIKNETYGQWGSCMINNGTEAVPVFRYNEAGLERIVSVLGAPAVKKPVVSKYASKKPKKSRKPHKHDELGGDY